MPFQPFRNRLILEKAFSSDAPIEESKESFHLCCCLSCPLHKEPGTENKGTKSEKKDEKKRAKQDTEKPCCIIPKAQQWPPGLSNKKSDQKNQQADKHSAICHWYDLLKELPARKGKATTIFLHGLGPDLTEPLFPEPSPDILEDSGSKEYSIYMSQVLLKREGVIRITFDGNESWSAPDIDGQGQVCVNFHQMVSAACPSAICIICRHCAFDTGLG
jgi:hypothetical protein